MAVSSFTSARALPSGRRTIHIQPITSRKETPTRVREDIVTPLRWRMVEQPMCLEGMIPALCRQRPLGAVLTDDERAGCRDSADVNCRGRARGGGEEELVIFAVA